MNVLAGIARIVETETLETKMSRCVLQSWNLLYELQNQQGNRRETANDFEDVESSNEKNIIHLSSHFISQVDHFTARK